MRTNQQLKKPFGTARMVDITHVRYLAWEDAFDVEFEDGLSFLEPHATIRKANRISAKARPVEVVLDTETRGGFEVRYDTGEVAEVSWAFIRELPPKRNGKKVGDMTVYRREDGSWAIKRSNSNRISSVHGTQSDAIRSAREILQRQGGEQGSRI